MADIKVRNVPDDLLWQVKTDAMAHHMTLRQWVLFVLSGNKGSTVHIAPGATAPGQVDLGSQLDPSKKSVAAAPHRVVTKARPKAGKRALCENPVRIADIGPEPASGVGKVSVETLHSGDGIPLELCGLQPTVADTYGGITRGDGPVQNSVDPAGKFLREVEESRGWTEEQWEHYYETHRINPATGAQYPNKEFCSLRESDSCNRYNTGGHCLMCR